MMEISYDETRGFKKDFKKLSKRFKTLNDDLKVAKQYTIEIYHINKIDNQSIFLIPGFCSQSIQVYKLKKFACRALKGRGNKSGLRIIYAFLPQEMKIVFLEIYFKGDKPNEDKQRIKEMVAKLLRNDNLGLFERDEENK